MRMIMIRHACRSPPLPPLQKVFWDVRRAVNPWPLAPQEATGRRAARRRRHPGAALRPRSPLPCLFPGTACVLPTVQARGLTTADVGTATRRLRLYRRLRRLDPTAFWQLLRPGSRTVLQSRVRAGCPGRAAGSCSTLPALRVCRSRTQGCACASGSGVSVFRHCPRCRHHLGCCWLQTISCHVPPTWQQPPLRTAFGGEAAPHWRHLLSRRPASRRCCGRWRRSGCVRGPRPACCLVRSGAVEV